jgi:hypothetical protein
MPGNNGKPKKKGGRPIGSKNKPKAKPRKKATPKKKAPAPRATIKRKPGQVGRPKGATDLKPRASKGIQPLRREIEKSERAQVRKLAMAAFNKLAEIGFQIGEFDANTLKGKLVTLDQRMAALKELVKKGLPDLSEVDVNAAARVTITVAVPTDKEEARRMVEENQRRIIDAEGTVKDV